MVLSNRQYDFEIQPFIMWTTEGLKHNFYKT